MKYMAAYDSKVLTLNTTMLLSIAFIPFSTAFVFENILSHSPLPLLVYNLNYIVAAFINYRLFTHILNPKNNLCSEQFTGTMSDLKKELLFPIFVYSLVIVLAFITPEFAGLGYAAFGFRNSWTRSKKNEVLKPADETESTETTVQSQN